MICQSGSSRPLHRTRKRHCIFPATTTVLASSALTLLVLSFGNANAVTATSTTSTQTRASSHDAQLLSQRQSVGQSLRFSRRSDVEFFNLANLELSDDVVSPVGLTFGRDELRSTPPLSSQEDASIDSLRRVSSTPVYQDDLVGKQTPSGYVFTRRADLRSFIGVPQAAVASFLSRRDLRISHPPLVPNSNSRLLIGLILLCILALGVLTVAVQHMWTRIGATRQPGSPLRRRSGDGRSSRSSLRADFQYVPLTPTDVGGVLSLEEEEEGIITPPALVRKGSGALSNAHFSSYDADGSDMYTDSGRRSPQDLHYISLPFGLGIGFSYSQINDRSATEARISSMGTSRWPRGKRERSSSEQVTSASALPTLTSTGISGADGLRSRARSFKDMCRDVMHTAAGRDSSKTEEDSNDMSTASTSSWLPSSVAADSIGSDSGSGATTPTAHLTSAVLRPSISDVALDELFSPSATGSKGKARFFATDDNVSTSHTLVDLGHISAGPEATLSDPHEITRPASSPAAPLPSQIPRHPQVEQLRRQGRTETGKRVGKGTPTNTKVF